MHSATSVERHTMRRGYRILKDSDYAYFVTMTVVEWLPVFASAPYGDLITVSLRYVRAHKSVQVNAYVIMPSHMHLILRPEPGINLSDVLRDFKRHTSRAISALLLAEGQHDVLRIMGAARPHGKGRESARFRVWQEGSHPEAICSQQFFRQKLEYIHNNPVKKGLVDRPEDWGHSSARNYVLGDDSVLEIDCVPL